MGTRTSERRTAIDAIAGDNGLGLDAFAAGDGLCAG